MTSHGICLFCYKKIEKGIYHPLCIKKLFGTKEIPTINFSLKDIEALAREEINQRVAITGVQPKLSLEITKDGTSPRLTIVKLWGDYIFKSPTKDYPALPENEDICMHLASLCGINTAIHGLMPLKSNELAYISKRFDRQEGVKVAQEDLCQLTLSSTDEKYNSSMEKVGKTIARYTTNPVLDLVAFFDLTIFCFIIGNADMHLKNFSLITDQNGEIRFSPAYDLVSTVLVLPHDKEELALPIQGKKNGLTRKIFLTFAENLSISKKAAENSLDQIINAIPHFDPMIEKCFLPVELKEKFHSLINSRVTTLRN